MKGKKVLLVGSYGFLMNHLVKRLHRERCEIYTIAGKDAKLKALRLPNHTIFEFSPEDVAVKYVMSSVQPDVVVFIGAQDDSFDWNDDRSSALYSARLSNVLVWAKTCGVPRFIYLSSLGVFEQCGTQALSEDQKPEPLETKNIMFYSGESLCLLHSDKRMAVTVLRLPVVYGPHHFLYETLNHAAKVGLALKADETPPVLPWDRYMIIYVSDAADAIYKAIATEHHKQQLYHVEGREVISDEELVCMLKEDGEMPLPETKEAENILAADGSRFHEEFFYTPRVDSEVGMLRTADFIENNWEALLEDQKKYRKEEERRRQQAWREDLRIFLSSIKRILSTLALFAIVFLVMMMWGESDIFQQVDLMLFYIILVALTSGIGESVLAALLATAGNLTMAMGQTGLGVSTLIGQYPVIFGFLFYLISALIISYTRMRYQLRIREKEEDAADIQEEYDMLYEVNKTNVEIKRTFENRLLNYGDSIGKIFSIVSELDVLNPERVVEAALDVVQRIMRVRDVCIYQAGQDGYFHIVGASTESARAMDRSFVLKEYTGLYDALQAREIFVDRTVGSGLPRMAAPIYMEDRLIYIIMLWNIEFNQLDTYMNNLFVVLSNIITSSLKKGYQYQEADRSRNYYGGTDILLPKTFRQRIEEKLSLKPYEEADYSIIRIDPEDMSLKELSGRLKPLIREGDTMGKLKDGEKWVYLLVRANCADAGFVVNKLSRNEIKSEAVSSYDVQ